MFRLLAGAIAVAFAMAVAAPAAGKARDDVIVARMRHPYAFCAGSCPHFEMKVAPDGSVVSHDPDGDPDGTTYRYRVSTRQLERFRHRLARLRPRGLRQMDKRCEQATLSDGSADPLSDPRPDDVEVRWIGPRSEARVTSCVDTHRRTRRSIERAVRGLGAELLTGNRADSAPAVQREF